MKHQTILDDDAAWAAVLARDRAQDGRFVTGVLTTGIYCRPSCAARHPKRENVRFFADGAGARAAGLRACLRCLPDDVAADEAGVARAIALIDRAETAPSLAELAQSANYSPHHFHRLFRRATGITPAAFVRARRADRAQQALKENETVTEALYDAGYSGPSRFYADMGKRLGMTPSAWRAGGDRQVVRWAVAETELGPLLIAATDKGVCRVAFADDAGELAERFPNARIEPGGAEMRALVTEVTALVASPGRALSLPRDVRGTAFQEAVWAELSRVPPGETVSYAVLAARAGKPGAARAAGSACGANPLALIVPCHRAQRGDGSLGGYAWGLDRKQALLARERSAAAITGAAQPGANPAERA